MNEITTTDKTEIVAAPPKAPLLVSMERREQAISDACSDSGVRYINLMTSLQKAVSKDSKILQCTPASVLDSLMACAKLGIDPSGEHNSGWFIRYGSELKLMIGYNGFIDLITRSGQYTQVEAEVVFKGEEFKVHRGTRNEIIHEFDLDCRSAPSNMIVACYAFARGPSGSQFVALTLQDINRARGASKNKSLWDKHYPEMVKKSAVRNLAKWMVLDRIGKEAVAISDDADGYDFKERPTGVVSDLRDSVGRFINEKAEAPENEPEPPTKDAIPFDADEIGRLMDGEK